MNRAARRAAGSKRRQMSPAEAVARFERGEILHIPINQVVDRLGMTAEEFLPYLQSGDIVAHADAEGYITLRSDELIEWMARHGRTFVKLSG